MATAGVGGEGRDSGTVGDLCVTPSAGKNDHDFRTNEGNYPPVQEIQSRDVCHEWPYQGKVGEFYKKGTGGACMW